jgi:hypothetical protein
MTLCHPKIPVFSPQFEFLQVYDKETRSEKKGNRIPEDKKKILILTWLVHIIVYFRDPVCYLLHPDVRILLYQLHPMFLLHN